MPNWDIARESLGVLVSEALTPGRFRKWKTSLTVEAGQTLSKYGFGEIFWRKSLGKPTSAHLADAFTLECWCEQIVLVGQIGGLAFGDEFRRHLVRPGRLLRVGHTVERGAIAVTEKKPQRGGTAKHSADHHIARPDHGRSSELRCNDSRTRKVNSSRRGGVVHVKARRGTSRPSPCRRMRGADFPGVQGRERAIKADRAAFSFPVEDQVAGAAGHSSQPGRAKALAKRDRGLRELIFADDPGPGSEDKEHHTHYLVFRDAYRYVQAYWEGHPEADRCWVPWGWCDTRKMQRENNSIVIFSPTNLTMHGVKASYDHLGSQRTQLYGNLWYHAESVKSHPEWEDFVITETKPTMAASLKGRVKSVMPASMRAFIKNRMTGGNYVARK